MARQASQCSCWRPANHREAGPNGKMQARLKKKAGSRTCLGRPSLAPSTLSTLRAAPPWLMNSACYSKMRIPPHSRKQHWFRRENAGHLGFPRFTSSATQVQRALLCGSIRAVAGETLSGPCLVEVRQAQIFHTRVVRVLDRLSSRSRRRRTCMITLQGFMRDWDSLIVSLRQHNRTSTQDWPAQSCH